MKKISKELTNIKEVISFIGTKNFLLFKPNSKIVSFNALNSVKSSELTFCSLHGEEAYKLISNSKSGLIICHTSVKKYLKNGKSNYIFVEKPRLWFIRCMTRFIPKEEFKGIHETAIIEARNVPKTAYIGSNTHIGKDVKIGQNCKIFSNSVIIGKTSLGKNVSIDSCSVIGSEGFGFERNKNNSIEMFPHIGGTEIQDNVEIGANVCIDKGTLRNTIIGKGTKIDNLVHIGHNVVIGKNCSIVANTLVGGSCIIGDGVHIAMSVTIRDGVKIGKNSLLGMGSVITKDIPPNSIVMGNPARLV